MKKEAIKPKKLPKDVLIVNEENLENVHGGSVPNIEAHIKYRAPD